jgi:hypothetical protein
MGIFSCFFGWMGWGGGDTYSGDQESTLGTTDNCCHEVNPATSLPMGSCGLDVAWNPYGVNLSQHDYWPSCDAGTSMDTNSSAPFSVWDD